MAYLIQPLPTKVQAASRKKQQEQRDGEEMPSPGPEMAVTVMSSQRLGFPAQDQARQKSAEEEDSLQEPYIFREQFKVAIF